MQINILEARNRLSQLLAAVRAGEEVVIANRGRPVARLVAVEAAANHPTEVGSPARILNWLKQNPLPTYAQRSAAKIDADVQAERDAWD